METDYPAAHSMDTTFFAIDAAGHVAVFESGENGHVPEIASDDYDLLVEMWRLRHPGKHDPPYIEEMAAELGAFTYYCDESFYDDYSFDQVGPYRRSSCPEVALHLDQLSPSVRQQAKQIRFDKIDFARSELVQPLEEYPCVFWYEEGALAYLCSDGKTVRPIPGKEDQFTEFCDQFRKENPNEAKKFIFAAPQNKAKKSLSPRKRRKKDEKDS
jgi:hypothetical protein